MNCKCNRDHSLKCPAMLRTTTDMSEIACIAVDHEHVHADDLVAIEALKTKINVLNKSSLSRRNTCFKPKDSDECFEEIHLPENPDYKNENTEKYEKLMENTNSKDTIFNFENNPLNKLEQKNNKNQIAKNLENSKTKKVFEGILFSKIIIRMMQGINRTNKKIQILKNRGINWKIKYDRLMHEKNILVDSIRSDRNMRRPSVLNKKAKNKEYTYKGHSGSVDQLCWHKFNPDLLSTASGDKTVKVWDVRHQKCSNTILTKGENINITWSPDGHTIAVGNKEDLITFIDMRTLKPISEQQFNFEVNEMSWNNESDLFFLTNGLGCVHVLSFPDLVQRHIVKAHPGTCICIEFAPNGHYFAVGSADASVSLWDLENLACVQTYTRLDWPVRALSFSYDGKMLASGSEDLYVDIADVTTGEKITDIPIEAATFTVAWHPKQYLLAFACDDKEQFDRKRDTGNLKVFGFSSE